MIVGKQKVIAKKIVYSLNYKFKIGEEKLWGSESEQTTVVMILMWQIFFQGWAVGWWQT